MNRRDPFQAGWHGDSVPALRGQTQHKLSRQFSNAFEHARHPHNSQNPTTLGRWRPEGDETAGGGVS